MEFPTENEILQQWFKSRTIIQLIGFENTQNDGKCGKFNFNLSNGARSEQILDSDEDSDVYSDEDYPYFDHMIPKKALKKIRSVRIYHGHDGIYGFIFFDKYGARLWRIGNIDPDCEYETVVLAENEVIVGVLAKLLRNWRSIYTDF